MNNYLNIYDSLEKKLVYNFKIGDGGIGDLIKFFMFLLNIGIKYNIKIYYLINNIPIEKYLKLNNEKMYIRKDEILNNAIEIYNYFDIQNINSNHYYIIKPYLFYDSFSFSDLNIPFQEVFNFSNEVKINTLVLNDKSNYISIHLRLGDKFLETDRNYVLCKEDVRNYNENNIFNFIENNSNKNIYFFCDNYSYKLKIKEKYSNIIITYYDIGHTSLSNTTEQQVLNTLKEFYLLTNSEHIYIASNSGFSKVASKFKNIPITEI